VYARGGCLIRAGAAEAYLDMADLKLKQNAEVKPPPHSPTTINTLSVLPSPSPLRVVPGSMGKSPSPHRS